MRRRLQTCFPIIAIALLVQLLAPLGALRAAAMAAADPVAASPICSGIGVHSQRPSEPAQANDGHCCAFCAAGSVDGYVPTPAPFVVTALQRQYRRTDWQHAPMRPVALRSGSNSQARAPPIRNA